MMKVGPLGNNSGEKWEELCSERISHIFVSFDDRYLTSIQFGYVKNGALVMSKKHGSSFESNSTRIVRLNHVPEFVTGISGECSYGGDITSLTFHTNQGTHETFRSTKYTSFRRKLREFHSGMHNRREFAGFFGSCSSSRLESIGLYLKPILSGVRVSSGFMQAMSFNLT